MNDETLITQLAATLVAGDLAGHGGGTGAFRYFDKGDGNEGPKLVAARAVDDAWNLLHETRERTSQKILGQFKPKFKNKL